MRGYYSQLDQLLKLVYFGQERIYSVKLNDLMTDLTKYENQRGESGGLLDMFGGGTGADGSDIDGDMKMLQQLLGGLGGDQQSSNGLGNNGLGAATMGGLLKMLGS